MQNFLDDLIIIVKQLLGDSDAVSTLYVSVTGLFGVTDAVLTNPMMRKSKVLLQEQQLN
jgi:hypothetical protein